MRCLLAAEFNTRTIISACSRSCPAAAPSSQSQVSVEDRAEGVLQRKRLENEFFAARKMLAAGNDRKRFFSAEKGLIGMYGW